MLRVLFCPPYALARAPQGAMRVDRRSRIHRILGLVPLSGLVAPLLRWLPAVATVLRSKIVSLDPGNRGSGFAGPPVSPPGGRAKRVGGATNVRYCSGFDE